MQSIEAIYRALLTRFNGAAPLFQTENLKPIAHIDRFKGQYLNPELHTVWNVPAIFLKFNITWENTANNKQRGAGILEVHVELDNYHESYLGSSDFEKALVDYKYLQIIHALVQGFGGDTWGPMSRITSDEDENPSNTNVTIIRYMFNVDDDSTDKYIDWITAKLDDMTTIRKPVPEAPALADEDEYHI